MPIYEYRCQSCSKADSFFLKGYSSAQPANCRHCGSASLQRIMSAFAYHRSEIDQLSQLDSKYYKMVDRALGNAPSDTHPSHYTDKMVPFSRAKETGEPYFKE